VMLILNIDKRMETAVTETNVAIFPRDWDKSHAEMRLIDFAASQRLGGGDFSQYFKNRSLNASRSSSLMTVKLSITYCDALMLVYI